ncbi:hypothetical protein GGF32_010095 [Allomyces javanicus]|nr:hypothetical protein GGF32_010095 [Allomyces javanicus]
MSSGNTGAPPACSTTPVKSAPTSTASALPAWVVRDPSTGLLPIYGRTDRGVVLGRGPQCTYDVGGVSTCSRKISRRHALLAWDAQARGFRLCVLGLNGAAVNGTHYYPDDCVPVADEPDPRPLVRKGDIVELPGNVKLVFRGAAPAPYPDSPIVCRVAEPSAELASSPLRPALASMQLALGPAPTSPTLASAVPPAAPRAPPLLGAKRPVGTSKAVKHVAPVPFRLQQAASAPSRLAGDAATRQNLFAQRLGSTASPAVRKPDPHPTAPSKPMRARRPPVELSLSGELEDVDVGLPPSPKLPRKPAADSSLRRSTERRMPSSTQPPTSDRTARKRSSSPLGPIPATPEPAIRTPLASSAPPTSSPGAPPIRLDLGLFSDDDDDEANTAPLRRSSPGPDTTPRPPSRMDVEAPAMAPSSPASSALSSASDMDDDDPVQPSTPTTAPNAASAADSDDSDADLAASDADDSDAESALLDAQMLAESPPDIQPPPMSLQDIIIESFTFCGRSDLSLGELYTEIAQNQAYFRAARGDAWKRAVLRALERTPFFALRPKNKLLTRATQWYYDPDRDIDRGRAQRYAEFGSAQPSRRAKARADKTYFFVDMTARKARNRDRYEEEPTEMARGSRRRSARSSAVAPREVAASDDDDDAEEDGRDAWQAPSSEATVPGTPLLKRRRMQLRLDDEGAQGDNGDEAAGSSARRRLFRSR